MRSILCPLMLLALAVSACSAPKRPAPKKVSPAAAAPKKGAGNASPAPPAKAPPSATQVTVLTLPKDARVLRAKKPLKGVKRGTLLKAGDVLITGKGDGVNFRHGDLGIGRLKPESRCVFQELFKLVPKSDGLRRSRIKLEKGSFGARLWRLMGKTRYEVSAPSMVMAARGTVFVVEVRADASQVIVTEGEVEVSLPKEPGKTLVVAEGQKAEVARALPAAPQPLEDADRRKAREFEELKARIISETDPMIARIDQLIAGKKYREASDLAFDVFQRAWGTKNAVRAQARGWETNRLAPQGPVDGSSLFFSTPPRFPWPVAVPRIGTTLLVANGWKPSRAAPASLPAGVEFARDPTGLDRAFLWSCTRDELRREAEKLLSDTPDDPAVATYVQGQVILHAIVGLPENPDTISAEAILERLRTVSLPGTPMPMARRFLDYQLAHQISDTNESGFPEACDAVVSDPDQPKASRLFLLYRRCLRLEPSGKAALEKFARQMLEIAKGDSNLAEFQAYAHAVLEEYPQAEGHAKRVLARSVSVGEPIGKATDFIAFSYFKRGSRAKADEWRALAKAHFQRVTQHYARERPGP